MATHALQHTPQDPFLKIPHSILQAPGFISRTTGEVLDFSLTQLVIFQWMKCCYNSYTGKGGTYHESQANIAKACRASVDTVKRTMTLLEKHGYLRKDRKWDGCVWQLPHSLEVAHKTPPVVAQEAPTTPSVIAVDTSQAVNDELDEPDFRPVLGVYGGTDQRNVGTEKSEDPDDPFMDQWADYEDREYAAVDVDVSTGTSHGAGAVLDRFLAHGRSIPREVSSTFYEDYDDRVYGYASAEDGDGPF